MSHPYDPECCCVECCYKRQNPKEYLDSVPIVTDDQMKQLAVTTCSRQWRSSVFWHSDVEDAVDRTVSDADHYSPKSRAEFLRAVIAELSETASKLEAENGQVELPPKDGSESNLGVVGG